MDVKAKGSGVRLNGIYVFQSYMRKEELLLCKQFWMIWSEKLVRRSMITVVTQMELVDHALLIGLLGDRLWADFATKQ